MTAQTAEVSADILEAAAWTPEQSGVDASRLSVIGWSYGGGGVLAALKTMPQRRRPSPRL
jgi:dienelactone hydrolase